MRHASGKSDQLSEFDPKPPDATGRFRAKKLRTRAPQRLPVSCDCRVSSLQWRECRSFLVILAMVYRTHLEASCAKR